VAAHVFSDFFVGNFFSHKPFLFAFVQTVCLYVCMIIDDANNWVGTTDWPTVSLHTIYYI
jgi:hypothetical protein